MVLRRRAQTRPRRRRDRHGRGLRGPLLPASLPAARTRAERFDDLVLDAVELLERRWAEQLAGVEFAVEDVPPSDPAPWEDDVVPLGRLFPAQGQRPARVVLYRRPLETRADGDDLDDLVADVVVEQVAHLLDLPPEDVDPRYGE
ncbi:metallopeptidase family protein [Kineococcus endophyticus]|uniref:Metallopeptidase family protein n=2 Tax=Kineococcus TaxID=33981 RepID=A0ABV3P767_9ACTN